MKGETSFFMNRMSGLRFADMVIQGASNLSQNADYVDSLNVFPVPDGDTGTNMNLSMTSGAKEVSQNKVDHVAKVAAFLSRGLLMGARGNSGVILSQLFRGFAKGVEGKEMITTKDFAVGLDQGVQTAYKAVLKPVEGTILTVAKDMAKKALEISSTIEEFEPFLAAIVQEAQASLQKTPDLLPVLKEVGVVDSGGQGLVLIYEGFLQQLKGQETTTISFEEPPKMVKEPANAQSHLNTEDIVYGYCTEFMIKLDSEKLKANPFDEAVFREALSHMGDSLLVVSDESIVKVHIHAEYPGNVLTHAQKYGSLINMKIENMREQHTALLHNGEIDRQEEKNASQRVPYALVSVAVGSGIVELFKNMGVTEMIEGGQTMNPSTEDIVHAVEATNAEHVYVLPNNKNIILAAKQAKEICETAQIHVIETNSIPQGLAAVFAFQPKATVEENIKAMETARKNILSGQITFAVRDTQIDGIDIRMNDFMGILESKIVVTHPNKLEAAKKLLDQMITPDYELLTVLSGADATDEEVDALCAFLSEKYEEVEVEVHKGNQPLYAFIFSLE